MKIPTKIYPLILWVQRGISDKQADTPPSGVQKNRWPSRTEKSFIVNWCAIEHNSVFKIVQFSKVLQELEM